MNLPELFLNLLNMSISAGWLILAVLALRLLMKKAPKWLTCSLWALVAVRLVMPFSVESSFSLIPSTQTLPPEIITGNRFEISSGIPVIDHQINDVVLDSYYESVTVPADNGLNVMGIASLVWLAGVAILALYALFSYLHLRRKVAASVNLGENVYLCDYIESPFILGIIRPKIYLPSAMDQTQWPHVLAHERAHLNRRDHWWKPLGFAILSVYWFNPLIWLAYTLLCRDIELACDEKVIRELGEPQKKAYSQALLACSMPRRLIAACPLAFGEVGVKERVKTVLNYKKPAFWVIVTAILACAVTAVCFLTDPVIEEEKAEFTAQVISVADGTILVQPDEDSGAALSADRIWVSLPEGAPQVTPGDRVCVVFDGLILETYPGQIPGVYSIQVLAQGSTESSETDPPGSYYRFKTETSYQLVRTFSTPTVLDYDSYYIFDSGVFQIIEKESGEILFQCDLEDSQWEEYSLTDGQWDEMFVLSDDPELKDELRGALHRQISENLCLLLKDSTLYITFGYPDSDKPVEHFCIIQELVIG